MSDPNWGTQEMVDPFEIVIDHLYQRPEKKDLMQRIAANFDPMLFGRPICFRRDNKMLYCVDGQQRVTSLKIMDSPPRRIPIIAFSVVGATREAEVFVAINEARKALTGMEKHRGKVVAKDPSAVQIERAVERAGFSISVNNESPRAIGAVGALGYTHGLIGEDGVTQTLTVIREAWGDDRKAIDGNIIRTVAQLIDAQSKNGGYTRSKLVGALAKTTPSKLLRTAEEIHFDQGTPKRESVRRAFKKLARV